MITDWTFPNLSIEEEILRDAGIEVVARQCKTEEELTSFCSEADAVITQFARVNRTVISSMQRARGIIRYGIGVDNVDLDAARDRGIPVCNVPDYCIDEVADQTLAFLLATTRQVVPHARALREGNWGLVTSLSEMKALRDLTVSVVGFGRIGREVVKRLLAFKCAVQVFDPMVSAEEVERCGARAVSLEAAFANADVLTLHCPSTPQTRRMLNRESLATLPRGAVVINVSRGDLADSEALTQALSSGHLSAAALDVFDPEPIPKGHPILSMSNVVLAPHIASCSMPAVKQLRESAARLAVAAVQGGALRSVVNGVVKA